MPVHFLDTDLSRWDKLEGGSDGLVLTFFSDERPLRGAAGLADWRMCGRLSRLIRARKITGKPGETLMLPPGRRLPFERVLLFGLGDSRRFDEDTYREKVRWILDVVGRAQVTRYATQPPGRATGLIGARRALDVWLDEADKAARADDVIIIENHGGQKEMAEVIRYRGKRG